MESFWNKDYEPSFSSDICSFLQSKFSDIEFYPERISLRFPAVTVFQNNKREQRVFLDGTIEECYFFTIIVPYGGEDGKASDGAYWLLDKCLSLCEASDGFELGRGGISFKYFCRTENPSKYSRSVTGEDRYSAEIKMCVERKV